MAATNDLIRALSVALADATTAARDAGIAAERAGEDRTTPYDRVIARLEEEIATLLALRDHPHRWGDDDFCLICGQDGRV